MLEGAADSNSSRLSAIIESCLRRKPPIKIARFRCPRIGVDEFRQLASFAGREAAVRHCRGNGCDRRGRIGW